MQRNPKQYGLIKMSKGTASNAASLMKKPSIFDESDGSDSDSASTLQFQTTTTARKQAKVKITQAIEEDPSIFQYDEVYDEMKSNDKESLVAKKPVEKKSRYIGNMLKHKDVREKEQELREERKIQKEREMEGDEFKDKEAFVTSAYKNKLEQMRKAQQDIDRQENVDNILDVTKQGDLNGFYRSLYKNNLFNSDQVADANEDDIKEETQSVKFNKKSTNQKNLRERNLTTEENDEDDEENEEPIVIRSTTKLEQERPVSADQKSVGITVSTEKPKEAVPLEASSTALKRPSNETETVDDVTAEGAKDSAEAATEEVVVVKKPKIDRVELIRQMFTKRTVGQVFADARQRYLERSALRQIG